MTDFKKPLITALEQLEVSSAQAKKNIQEDLELLKKPSTKIPEKLGFYQIFGEEQYLYKLFNNNLNLFNESNQRIILDLKQKLQPPSPAPARKKLISK